MTTRITRTMRREIVLDGKPHTVVLTAAAVCVSRKGAKKRIATVTWGELVAAAIYRGEMT